MRRRILRATVLAVACAVLLFALPLGYAALRLYQQDEEREAQSLGQRVALSLPERFTATGDPVELPPVESGTDIAVYGTGSHRVLGTGPGAADAPVREAEAGRVVTRQIGDSLVVAVPVGGSEQVRAVVRVASPASEPLRRAALTWAGMLVLAAVAVGVGALLAVRSSRRLGRPLEELAGVAREMESGDLTARAEPSGLPEPDAVGHALARAAARIDELLRRERAFSADASHQLRTALTGVRLELEMSLAAGPDVDVPDADVVEGGAGAGSRAAVRSALAQLERMEATLDDLLALARDVPERAPLDLAALLARAREDWHGPLAAQGRRLEIRVDDALPQALGSRRAARQILDVLLSNAATHGRGTVTVHAKETAGVVAVDVEDEGDGIPEAGTDGVFERRGGEEGRSGGEGGRSGGEGGRSGGEAARAGGPAAGSHGIGLALARSLAEAEGGRLFVSRPRPRPRFTWLLAAAPVEEQETSQLP
ncbi:MULTISPECIES: HAMP domain-containing sensor histidine kinase [unclassified Streptomyces]|uniref:HAMP domain-containing sensor histidine kinase n=1 Tax=unclassified Streptomyces TaxID=2593676 RepID=UPI00225C1D98|nr:MULTISPECIES: ATP-binding protein [unclassified Streptomyces]MCX4795865.1 HAMP domain-containing histidine kinase [Streptomyces sp. NBC_01242]WSP56627.1 HAMP domain-containing histidine kinase [Streptomyces sp. NBC_01241]WSP63542.1 HAMP domain-containing histidine kinase [Streptomyces sp. NBC_01240]